uniref:Uncharacterized protein n=1 Tax=Dicentrarchus labrax TaxID=13489 RepID=E6ZFF5_DICLA|nr:Uncharacterized protein [Dicentrarchus labrax]
MKRTNILFLYIIFFLIILSLCFVLLIYRNGLGSSVMVLKKCLVFAKQGRQTRRQAMAQAHIIADNFLLCIAFSKDGSTVYLMFQQKNCLKAEDSPFYCCFLGTIFKKKDTADDGSGFV